MKCKAGQTPFIKSCFKGSVKVLEVLVREGAGKIDVNAKDNNGWTGFIIACICGHLAAIQELIKMDELDVNAKDNSGWTGFMIACFHGRLAIVRLLLDAKCDTEAKDNDGQTGDDLAVERNHSEVAELIRQHRADGRE